MEPTSTVTHTENEMPKEKEVKKVQVIACKNCGATDTTLIKATDSYYCKFCFMKLHKKKFEKKGKK